MELATDQLGAAQAEEDHVMAAFAIALSRNLPPEQIAYIKAHKDMALLLFKAQQTNDPHELAAEISQLLSEEHDLAAYLVNSHAEEKPALAG